MALGGAGAMRAGMARALGGGAAARAHKKGRHGGCRAALMVAASRRLA
jgi:hypothetical protein